ncbi:MAG: hypothetical protein A3I02_13680 [Betaproteobacteria bacterium RIFCSPLOWO2_02_FULL_67_26]|nr:MAG: hypothetical protein A3I02_13680 [Betaproteobacteria bacterium RIFCSPLOWO2_02_FULL_67_26]
MPVQKIGDVIATSGNLEALARKARRLRDLQQLLFEASPPSLAAASGVADLKSGTLIVVADNAAVAAKLRQLAPRLLLHVREQANEVTGIRVEVQVKPHKIKAEDKFTPRPLPPDAIQDFARLSDALPDSPLKSALHRLVVRGRAKVR